ncbi:prepilin peptidase [Liquorilactobacillus mali]|uniref:Peptidase n=1 Tax=Liquorilactobacillus mali KCTC 3596 = DSM 20444 TaxID=1046596 RepID=J1F2Y4_9LACO|nr:A24 family peptidase [Liquorilactobacillus mali]EJE99641.1 Type IV prepilin leader peptidase [Liquorilactobacillus mali KCTC 3596 = DSM 20444]KRN09668.1 peptidase [Liquorilactobacillus mali KCTC 3596 = DSM 20444]MDC7952925.1 prepilin peptidase [Liquorilactobacillus mali]MDV7758377.1 prepilin peptidase [Liquorilactobacillus mali]QFQ73930.1 prepilin peptidase [Liquorilactobacillus mali]
MYNVLIFLLGSVLSSFTVCYSWRYVNNISQLQRRSFCEQCHHPLKAWQLIPILGFFLQKGRCFFCTSRISPLSTIIEFLGGSLAVFCHSNYSRPYFFVLFSFIMWSLCLGLQDYKLYAASSNILYLGFLIFSALSIIFLKFSFSYFLQFFLLLSVLVYFSIKKMFGWADVLYIITSYFVVGYQYTLYLLLIASTLCILFFLITHLKKAPFLPFQALSFIIIIVVHPL